MTVDVGAVLDVLQDAFDAIDHWEEWGRSGCLLSHQSGLVYCWVRNKLVENQDAGSLSCSSVYEFFGARQALMYARELGALYCECTCSSGIVTAE
jgi:hypothetical protein